MNSRQSQERLFALRHVKGSCSWRRFEHGRRADSTCLLRAFLGRGVLTRSHAERLVSRDGYFPSESVIRRIGNSVLTPFLGGGPAVLLQVARPLVAAGVVQQSDFERDLWGRLVRTLCELYLIAFGTKAEAERAGEIVRAVHAHVAGTTRPSSASFPAGTRYSASDP
jgi:hypothetical protein